MSVSIIKGVVFSLAFAASAVVADVAFAQAAPAQDCKAQLEDLKKQWADIGLPSPVKANTGIERGKKGHEHTGGEVSYMTRQLSLADKLCVNNQEHEAMLRMDVVRAMLQLPEVQHPASHHYSNARQ